MKSNEYSTREVLKILSDNGFSFHRKGKGDHMIYRKDDKIVSIPVAKKSVNRMMFKRLCRENGIIAN